MAELDYQLVDFDNHYYEPEDAFTRHGDDEVQRFVRWVSDGKKRHLTFGNKVAAAIPNPTFNPIGKPGAFHQRLKELKESGEARNLLPMDRFGEIEPLPDHYHDRDARLRTMDEQGVERAVFFPTLGVGIDGLNADDVRMTYKVFRAFNLWLDDDWGFNRDGRIYAAPFIPMLDPQLACAELDFALERGSKVIVMRPGPRAGDHRPTRRGIRTGPASTRPAPSPRTTPVRRRTSTRSRSRRCGSATASVMPRTRATSRWR